MKKGIGTAVFFLVAAVALIGAAGSAQASRGGSGGRGDGPVIYVVGHGLYYDSIVAADPLPMKGRFQELRPTAGVLETQYGPGDRNYNGGRWWIDLNGNGEMDGSDKYFSCPLLGPGREER
jgi:hypothetical protein